MAELRLRSLDRLSYFRKQRRMRVPEGMRRNAWLLNPVAGRRKFTVVAILRTECSSARSGKEQIVRPARLFPGAMHLEHFAQTLTDWQNTVAAVRFRSAKITV